MTRTDAERRSGVPLSPENWAEKAVGLARLAAKNNAKEVTISRKSAEKAAKERAAILLDDKEQERGTKYAPMASAAPPPRPVASKAIKAAKIRAELKAAAVAKKSASTSAVTSQEVTEVPVGTWLVQIGAYDSRDVALSEWSRISRRNNDLFGSKKYTVQLAESGGRKFYRLRTVGFADAKSSKSFCTTLKQRKLDCIAVAVR